MTVIIGSKWTPEHRVVKDQETGEFQEVNPKMTSEMDLVIQAALLSPTPWPAGVSEWLRTHAETEDSYQLDALAEHASMQIREDR